MNGSSLYPWEPNIATSADQSDTAAFTEREELIVPSDSNDSTNGVYETELKPEDKESIILDESVYDTEIKLEDKKSFLNEEESELESEENSPVDILTTTEIGSSFDPWESNTAISADQ